MKYLVVDDSKLARLSLIKSLNIHINDEVIYQVANGLEAVEFMSNEKIDVVFLDLTLPIMNGYEALPKLLEINPKAKIIVVSADIQTKAQERVISLGALLHVKKPINTAKMREILDLVYE